MMNDRSVFHFISDVIHREEISCILIGGFAVNHYKVSRQTADIDFLISKEDFEKIIGAFEKAGYKKGSVQENFAHLQSTKISLLDVDFMFVDREVLEKISKEGKRMKIAGQSFVVPSLLHLIALKLHSIKYNPKDRITKDLPDIINLIKVNEMNVKDKQFKEMCLKYGTVDLYDTILKAII